MPVGTTGFTEPQLDPEVRAKLEPAGPLHLHHLEAGDPALRILDDRLDVPVPPAPEAREMALGAAVQQPVDQIPPAAAVLEQDDAPRLRPHHGRHVLEQPRRVPHAAQAERLDHGVVLACGRRGREGRRQAVLRVALQDPELAPEHAQTPPAAALGPGQVRKDGLLHGQDLGAARDDGPHAPEPNVQHVLADVHAGEALHLPHVPDRRPAPAALLQEVPVARPGRHQARGQRAPVVELQVPAGAHGDLEHVAAGLGAEPAPQLGDAVPVLRLVEVQVELQRGLDGRAARRHRRLVAGAVDGRGRAVEPDEGGREGPQTQRRGPRAEERYPPRADQFCYAELPRCRAMTVARAPDFRLWVGCRLSRG